MAGRPKKTVAINVNAVDAYIDRNGRQGYAEGDTITIPEGGVLKTAVSVNDDGGVKEVSKEVLELRKTLDQIGISYEESDDITQLAMKLAKESRRINESSVSSATDLANKKFASYAPGTNLTDKDFLRRLFLLGVPGFYLKPHYSKKNPGAPIFLFNDMDHKLKDDRIWERIRFSGVTQKSFKEVMSKYSTQPGSSRKLTPLV